MASASASANVVVVVTKKTSEGGLMRLTDGGVSAVFKLRKRRFPLFF